MVAGLMLTISSCQPSKNRLELIQTKLLVDFPSASAIEYEQGQLYVFGDDAAYMTVFDTSYHQIDTVRYIADTNYRISKQQKQDIESATIVSIKNKRFLYALGSLTDQNRCNLFIFPLPQLRPPIQIDVSWFLKQLHGIAEVNIEGLAEVNHHLVMANRANLTHQTNQLIISDLLINQYNNVKTHHVIDLLLDPTTRAGVSGLYYLKAKDLLIFTASEEDTPSAHEDGAIHDSYIGWIQRFSSKISQTKIHPESFTRLSIIHPLFQKQKIESVCAEEVKDGNIILHLAADNDNGQSRLFKMKLKL